MMVCIFILFMIFVPFSPSERYLAVTRLPFQGHEPILGDIADVCIIDLQEQTLETIYSTKAWDYQLGANLNWGTSDRFLYTNDVIDGKAVCVQLDLETKEATAYSGPMYHIAPDASNVIGFPLDLINATATRIWYSGKSKGRSNFTPGCGKRSGYLEN